MLNVQIQPYNESRSIEIADLFHRSVHAVNTECYSAKQKEAWAPTPPDYTFWRERLKVKRPFMALVNDVLAGFIELEPDGHIDCMYTHPKFQGKGVASILYDYVENIAKTKGLMHLCVEASKVAKPFFEQRGFETTCQNQVQRRGVTLVNFSMQKRIEQD